MGRRPLGDKPMTAAEKQARLRRKAKEQPKWEYMFDAHHGDHVILNEFGSQGCELVAVEGQHGYFKRRVL